MPQYATGGVEDFVDVLFREDEFGGVDGDVVLGVFGVLNRAEQRVGASAQHDVEARVGGQCISCSMATTENSAAHSNSASRTPAIS